MKEWTMSNGNRVVECDIHIQLVGGEVERIEKALENYRNMRNAEGEYPFKDWTFEKALEDIIGLGLYSHIDRNVKNMGV